MIGWGIVWYWICIIYNKEKGANSRNLYRFVCCALYTLSEFGFYLIFLYP